MTLPLQILRPSNGPAIQHLMQKLEKIPDHFIYITTSDYNKFACPIFDAKIKQAKLVSKNDNVCERERF